MPSPTFPLSPPWLRRLVERGHRHRNDITLLLCVMVGCILWITVDFGGRLPVEAGRLVAVFVSVILALLTTDYPISVIAGLGFVALSMTKSLYYKCQTTDDTMVDCSLCESSEKLSGSACRNNQFSMAFDAALLGFSDEVNWLVFSAFHIGRAVEKTRLGRRLSLNLIRLFGRSILGLGYAVFLCELLLGPFVPSNTARGGGILLPIVNSVALILGSTPSHYSRLNGGEYLFLCGAHANLLSASLYPTGMAANPIVSNKALSILGIQFGYFTWVSGAIVPSLVLCMITSCLIRANELVFTLPYVLYLLSYKSAQSAYSVSDEDESGNLMAPDEIVAIDAPDESEGQSFGEHDQVSFTSGNMEEIRIEIGKQLESLGHVSFKECKLISILLACLTLWLTKSLTGFDTTAVAFAAVIAMVMMDVLEWGDITTWDTFFWLGILIMMADQLGKLGVSSWAGHRIAETVEASGSGSVVSALLLGLIYFFSMYMFSSLTGHIVAFVGPFLEAGRALQCPPLLITAIFAYFSTLCGCLTNFSSGPIVLYFSQGYSSRKRWFGIGLFVGMIHVAVFFSFGLLWWKILNWW